MATEPIMIDQPEFYVLWKEGTTGPLRQISDFQEATAESERLTRMHGCKVHILAHMATVEKVDIKNTQVAQLQPGADAQAKDDQ